MSKVLVDEQNLSDIADSIRAKNGTQDTYKPSEMSGAIDAIPSGGSTSSIDVGNRKIKLAFSTFQEFDATGLDFSNCVDMQNMFNNCSSLQTIPLINTSNVTNMQNMFSSCNRLQTIPLINTSNVTNMQNMFSNCSVLETIPLIDTSKVINISQMFNSCASLKSIPLINTSNATNMMYMFGYCRDLENVPKLDTSSVTNMQNMFINCNKLTDTSLDNILQMCVGATSYNGTKTLRYLGINSTNVYPVSRIEALPHYQDFINAGWTTGY